MTGEPAVAPIRSLLLVAVLVVSAALVAACGGGSAAASVTPPPDAAATITARNVAFDPGSVHLPAGQASRLFFRNLDGTPHNVAVYSDSSAATSLFVGGTITNSATVYEVPALPAGHYFLRCDVHPSMTGSVDVGS
jgi:plastocyanin